MGKIATYREFLTAVLNGDNGEDVRAYAESEVVKLDERNANRKPTKDELAAAARRDLIYEYVKTHPKTGRDAIAAALSTDEEPITAGQVTGACTVLVKNGVLKSEKISVSRINPKGKSVRAEATIYTAI